MTNRMAESPRERDARSRLRQLLNESEWLRANYIQRTHPCGQASCHCKSDKRHWHGSSYVSQSRKGKLRMKYVPSERVAEIRRWVARYQLARRLLMVIGDASWGRVAP